MANLRRRPFTAAFASMLAGLSPMAYTPSPMVVRAPTRAVAPVMAETLDDLKALAPKLNPVVGYYNPCASAPQIGCGGGAPGSRLAVVLTLSPNPNQARHRRARLRGHQHLDAAREQPLDDRLVPAGGDQARSRGDGGVRRLHRR